MSRVAKKPVALPKGVDCQVQASAVTVKGPKGTLKMTTPAGVDVAINGSEVQLSSKNQSDLKMAGTMRALINNMVKVVSEGYAKKLELVGVGYRAAMQSKDLNLTLDASRIRSCSRRRKGITIEVPAQSEIWVKGADKQRVGEVAAKIRAFRPPEPYKGKGVRYSGEKITLKEAKKA